MKRRGKKYDYDAHAKKMMKKLPTLPKGWTCEVIPYGHEDSEAPTFDNMFLVDVGGCWGFVIYEEKKMRIFPGEDGLFALRDRWGRIFGFEEGFALIYCHEWYHAISKDNERNHREAETFAYAWCKAKGIIF